MSVHVTVTTTWVVPSNSPQPKHDVVSNVSNVSNATFHNIWGVQGASTVNSAAGFMQWCQSCKFRATRTIPHLCKYSLTAPRGCDGRDLTVYHIYTACDTSTWICWLATSTVTGSKTSALYTKHSCILRAVYYTHTIHSSSRRHWFHTLFLCLLTFQVGLQEPTRSPWSCQDLRIWPSRSIRPPSWSVSPQETQGPLFPGAG